MTSKKENILEESYPGLMTADDFWPLWDSLGDIWRATKVAGKDLIGTSAFLLKMTFRIFLNDNRIEAILENNKSRKDRIWNEYEGIVKAGEGRFPATATDLHLFSFLGNPGSYVAYRMITDGKQYFDDTKDMLLSQGINVRPSSRGPGGYDDKDPTGSLARAFQNILSGGDSPELTGYRKSLLRRLNRVILGKLDESKSAIQDIRNLLKEEKEVSDPATEYKKSIQAFKGYLENNISQSPKMKSAFEKALQEKRREISQAVEILKSPQVFVLEAMKSKNLEDFSKAVKVLEKTPFQIDEKSLPKKEELKKAASEMVKKAKEDNKVELILQSAGIKPKEGDKGPKEEDLLSIAEAVLTKNAIEKLVSQLREPNSDLSKSVEKSRKIFLENIVGIDKNILDILPEEVKKIYSKGREDISKAGRVFQESK